MILRTALLTAFVAVAGLSPALAQTTESSSSGPGKVEASIIPGGGIFFTEGKDSHAPSFGNYDLGGSLTVNVNRYVGIEGEVGGGLGVSQNLDFAGASLSDTRTPHLLNYSGNVIVHVARGPVVPYVTGGVGGLSLFEQADLGVNDTETFFTGNVGAGVKWYSGRLGLRGDYRFIAVQSNDNAPAFFGQEKRYGHRVYGGIVINVAR
jgi:hypothetical protein